PWIACNPPWNLWDRAGFKNLRGIQNVLYAQVVMESTAETMNGRRRRSDRIILMGSMWRRRRRRGRTSVNSTNHVNGIKVPDAQLHFEKAGVERVEAP
ncbi:unnamed protein product, partial [Pleuronectes platessa]